MKTKQLTVTDMMNAVQEATNGLPEDFTILSTDQKLELAKPRGGFEAQVEPLAEVAKEVKTPLPGTSIDVVREQLAKATAIHSLRNAVKKVFTRVDDTIHRKRALAWRVFASYYGALNAMAQTNPALAEDLEPLKEVFEHGPVKPKAAVIPKPQPVIGATSPPAANSDVDDDDEVKAVVS